MFVCFSRAAEIRFRSRGKNYDINYNSNTKRNFNVNQLLNTIYNQLNGGQDVPSNPCASGLLCSSSYDHFSASFSFDDGSGDEKQNDDVNYDYDDFDEVLSKESDIPKENPPLESLPSEKVSEMSFKTNDSKPEVSEMNRIEISSTTFNETDVWLLTASLVFPLKRKLIIRTVGGLIQYLESKKKKFFLLKRLGFILLYIPQYPSIPIPNPKTSFAHFIFF